jgi:threonine synthase
VLEKLIARGVMDPKSRIVVISTANGLKFTEFKVRYHDRTLAGVSSRRANPPITLPANFEKVVEAIEQRHRS